MMKETICTVAGLVGGFIATLLPIFIHDRHATHPRTVSCLGFGHAEEGTFAHEICEYKVRKYLHERVKRPQSEEFDTEEIEQITDVYLQKFS